MNQWLHDTLHQLTPVEQLQLDSHQNINAMDLDYIHDPIPKIPQADLFKTGDIAITKNNRFSYVPAHTHNFIELNYLYSGTCTQYINGEKVVLHAHNLLLMDKEIVQQIEPTGEPDILVNLLIKDDTTITRLFDYIPVATNKITEFLYNAAQVNTLHNNFILFDLTDAPVADDLVNDLVMKGLTKSRHRNKVMTMLLSTLLMELSESIETEFTNFADMTNDDFLPVLQYINQHFATVTLASASAHFNYNANYLSNKIKANTGRTFKELIDRRRLAVAQNLMIKTPLSLSDICDQLGYENSSSLFRLFQRYLQTSPSAYKKKVAARPLNAAEVTNSQLLTP